MLNWSNLPAHQCFKGELNIKHALRQCARWYLNWKKCKIPKHGKSCQFAILVWFPVKVGIKEIMLYKAPVYVLYLHIETNQVQSKERKIYNLHSTRQCGRIGDVVGSSLEFLNRGKLLGNDPVASRTLTGAHLRPPPSHHLHHTEHRLPSTAALLSERWHVFFMSTTTAESLKSFLHYRQQLRDWLTGSWSGKITTQHKKDAKRSRWWMQTVLLYCPLKQALYRHIIGSVCGVYWQLWWKASAATPGKYTLKSPPPPTKPPNEPSCGADLTGDLPCN